MVLYWKETDNFERIMTNLKKYYALLSILLFLALSGQSLKSQDAVNPMANPHFNKAQQQGTFYFYFGWNRGYYTKSDLHFSGDDYEFTIHDATAQDRQSTFGIDPYFKLTKFTYPQTNVQFGYYIRDNWRISFGIDHMKYVLDQGQTANVSGEIQNTNPQYDGVYENTPVLVDESFLEYEHTDGLNYYNFELKRTQNMLDWFKWSNRALSVEVMGGVGLGFYIPRSDVTLLGKERNDKFHLAGYGFSSMVGLNLTFFNHFFVETEAKGGFVHLPDVRTTQDKSDRANQHFWFAQKNLVLGCKFRFGDYREGK